MVSGEDGAYGGDGHYRSQTARGGRIGSVATLIAVAANTDGRHDIIGIGVGPSQTKTFSMDFLRSLRARGLDGVKLVISDLRHTSP